MVKAQVCSGCGARRRPLHEIAAALRSAPTRAAVAAGLQKQSWLRSTASYVLPQLAGICTRLGQELAACACGTPWPDALPPAPEAPPPELPSLARESPSEKTPAYSAQALGRGVPRPLSTEKPGADTGPVEKTEAK